MLHCQSPQARTECKIRPSPLCMILARVGLVQVRWVPRWSPTVISGILASDFKRREFAKTGCSCSQAAALQHSQNGGAGCGYSKSVSAGVVGRNSAFSRHPGLAVWCSLYWPIYVVRGCPDEDVWHTCCPCMHQQWHEVMLGLLVTTCSHGRPAALLQTIPRQLQPQICKVGYAVSASSEEVTPSRWLFLRAASSSMFIEQEGRNPIV